MKAVFALIMAAALISPAQAALKLAPPASHGGAIILVEGGCGPDYHRGPEGRCRPNWREWERGWRACPPGYHLGREGQRCWPN